MLWLDAEFVAKKNATTKIRIAIWIRRGSEDLTKVTDSNSAKIEFYPAMMVVDLFNALVITLIIDDRI